MKKIIFLKKVWIEIAVENWSVREIVRKLGLKLTYNQYSSVSDQEVEVWENLAEPWAVDAPSFKRAFSGHYKTIGGD